MGSHHETTRMTSVCWKRLQHTTNMDAWHACIMGKAAGSLQFVMHALQDVSPPLPSAAISWLKAIRCLSAYTSAGRKHMNLNYSIVSYQIIVFLSFKSEETIYQPLKKKTALSNLFSHCNSTCNFGPSYVSSYIRFANYRTYGTRMGTYSKKYFRLQECWSRLWEVFP